jgi:hypothetical protein
MDDGFLREPCTCAGNNPSCFKCGGWGYIDVIGNARSAAGAGEWAPKGTIKRTTINTARKAKSKTKKLFICPQCGAECTNLPKHIKKIHEEKPAPKVHAVRYF